MVIASTIIPRAPLPLRGFIKAAAGIREIVESTQGIDQQGRKIIAMPWYDYVRENALKIVRRVVIRVEYIATRVLTPDEIYERYMTDEGYKNGTAEKDYEYYQLMMRLAEEKRWDELTTISKAAYDNMYGALGSKTDLRKFLNSKTVVKGGILEEQCSTLLREYFKKIR